MAHLDTPPPDFLEAVAGGIGGLLDRKQSASPGVHPQTLQPAITESPALKLAETLQIWKLTKGGAKALAGSGFSGDLHDWIEPTPFRYHLIRVNGVPEGFARSVVNKETGAVTILNVNASPIAAKVAELLQLIEESDSKDPVMAADPVVRLLEIPACRVFALWAYAESIKESRVIIIYATDVEPMTPEPLMNSAQFFTALYVYRPIRDVS